VSDPVFFAKAADFRRWLERHHATASELLVGFHKRDSGTPSMTWPESVDEALSFGWIDGIRRRIDEHSYSIRFTPRKPTSVWSAVNVKNVERLIAEGRMTPAGLEAYEARTPERTGIYSFERPQSLDADSERLFKRNKKAWRFFESQAPWYRRTVCHWIMSAKRPETRAKRLATLIAESASGQRIPQLRRSGEGR
jgi:uncharacterized protein YdeI (YjbR/CyaY-like superfamily)